VGGGGGGGWFVWGEVIFAKNFSPIITLKARREGAPKPQNERGVGLRDIMREITA